METKFEKLPQYDEDRSVSDSNSLFSESKGLMGEETTILPRKRSWTQWALPAAHLALFLLYTSVFFFFLRQVQKIEKQNQHVLFSPAQEAVKLEAMEFQGQLRIISPYQGDPSPELDQAWKDLLQYSNIWVTGEELSKINKTSIPVPDEEDKYWVELSVVHELHCIKRLRQYIHSDYYFANISAEDRRLNDLHTDHCLEILRQSVMCHADISMITMTWESTSKYPAADFQNEHECKNWDTLYEWQKERSVDMMKPGFLVHPYLGVPFPDGYYHGIGAADPENAIGDGGEDME
ncbi:uncharacterized protein N7479_009573 [Penicillium vulpinum]|uniref:Uncharacterized protein n=1 Tax=Penicillium vulpinum TaxID=29845 RepID=A0A1V6RYY3_9EURO|nr:uncharacterized protein N7479_009573 [Penicillium vulpinum]KAJ5951160.1 hypothetical protein N7479_009573 [Penicillium vulpinum]OQE06818.1 hypothetical protein PENVUL_c016G04256 [Penicillium vulpinum]